MSFRSSFRGPSRRSRSRSPFHSRQTSRRRSRSPQFRTKSWERRDRSASPRRNRRTSPVRRSSSQKTHERSRRSPSPVFKRKDRHSRHSPAKVSKSPHPNQSSRASPPRRSKSSHTDQLIRSSSQKDKHYSHNENLVQTSPRDDKSPPHSHLNVTREDRHRSSHEEPESGTMRKKISLNDRFGANENEFVLEENITIGLQWNRHSSNALDVIVVENVNFDFSSFALIRRVNEGIKQIFDRPEIKSFKHDEKLDDPDEYERRVISVLPKKSLEKDDTYSSRADVDLSVRKSLSMGSYNVDTHTKIIRSSFREVKSKDGYGGEPIRITRRRTPSPQAEPEIRLDPRPDPRYEAKYLASRDIEEQFSDDERMANLNPNDLRHSLKPRKDCDSSGDVRYKIEARRRDNRQLDEKSGRSRDHPRDEQLIRRRDQQSREERYGRGRDQLQRDDRPGRGRNHQTEENRPGRGRDAWDVASEHNRETDRKTSFANPDSSTSHGNLPDFSRRPAKFVYEEWKDRPDMVPKGRSYYEHDNRDGGAHDEVRGRDLRAPYSVRGFRRGSFNNRNTFRRSIDARPYSKPTFSARGRIRMSSRGREREPFGSRRREKELSFNKSTRSDYGEWKHDMYDKLEKEDDNKPTSTT